MNINAGNPSLQNMITRTLMGQKEKRPTFEEVFEKLSKNSATMNRQMPLNSTLTNEQMYRSYVQNTLPKLQKSNDSFGESELNTVLMRLLGNEVGGNAPAPPSLPPTAIASLGTIPLTTATPLPTTTPVQPVQQVQPVLPIAPVQQVQPAPQPTPQPAPSTTTTTPLLPTPSPTIPTTPPQPAPSTTTTTPLLPIQSLQVNVPLFGTATPPQPSPMNAWFSSLFTPNPIIPGLPPVPLAPVIAPTNLGAAFTSVTNPVPSADELAAQALAAQSSAATTVPTVEQVINKPTLGRKPEETDDPEKIRIQNARAILYDLKKKKTDGVITEDEIKHLKSVTKKVNKYYKNKKDQKNRDEASDASNREAGSKII